MNKQKESPQLEQRIAEHISQLRSLESRRADLEQRIKNTNFSEADRVEVNLVREVRDVQNKRAVLLAQGKDPDRRIHSLGERIRQTKEGEKRTILAFVSELNSLHEQGIQLVNSLNEDFGVLRAELISADAEKRNRLLALFDDLETVGASYSFADEAQPLVKNFFSSINRVNQILPNRPGLPTRPALPIAQVMQLTSREKAGEEIKEAIKKIRQLLN